MRLGSWLLQQDSKQPCRNKTISNKTTASNTNHSNKQHRQQATPTTASNTNDDSKQHQPHQQTASPWLVLLPVVL
jgi:hypothetical protein